MGKGIKMSKKYQHDYWMTPNDIIIYNFQPHSLHFEFGKYSAIFVQNAYKKWSLPMYLNDSFISNTVKNEPFLN